MDPILNSYAKQRYGMQTGVDVLPGENGVVLAIPISIFMFAEGTEDIVLDKLKNADSTAIEILKKWAELPNNVKSMFSAGQTNRLDYQYLDLDSKKIIFNLTVNDQEIIHFKMLQEQQALARREKDFFITINNYGLDDLAKVKYWSDTDLMKRYVEIMFGADNIKIYASGLDNNVEVKFFKQPNLTVKEVEYRSRGMYGGKHTITDLENGKYDLLLNEAELKKFKENVIHVGDSALKERSELRTDLEVIWKKIESNKTNITERVYLRCFKKYGECLKSVGGAKNSSQSPLDEFKKFLITASKLERGNDKKILASIFDAQVAEINTPEISLEAVQKTGITGNALLESSSELIPETLPTPEQAEIDGLVNAGFAELDAIKKISNTSPVEIEPQLQEIQVESTKMSASVESELGNDVNRLYQQNRGKLYNEIENSLDMDKKVPLEKLASVIIPSEEHLKQQEEMMSATQADKITDVNTTAKIIVDADAINISNEKDLMEAIEELRQEKISANKMMESTLQKVEKMGHIVDSPLEVSAALISPGLPLREEVTKKTKSSVQTVNAVQGVNLARTSGQLPVQTVLVSNDPVILPAALINTKTQRKTNQNPQVPAEQVTFEALVRQLIATKQHASKRNFIRKFISKIKGEKNYSFTDPNTQDKVRIKFKKGKIIKATLKGKQFDSNNARSSPEIERSICILNNILQAPKVVDAKQYSTQSKISSNRLINKAKILHAVNSAKTILNKVNEIQPILGMQALYKGAQRTTQPNNLAKKITSKVKKISAVTKPHNKQSNPRIDKK